MKKRFLKIHLPDNMKHGDKVNLPAECMEETEEDIPPAKAGVAQQQAPTAAVKKRSLAMEYMKRKK